MDDVKAEDIRASLNDAVDALDHMKKRCEELERDYKKSCEKDSFLQTSLTDYYVRIRECENMIECLKKELAQKEWEENS